MTTNETLVTMAWTVLMLSSVTAARPSVHAAIRRIVLAADNHSSNTNPVSRGPVVEPRIFAKYTVDTDRPRRSLSADPIWCTTGNRMAFAAAVIRIENDRSASRNSVGSILKIIGNSVSRLKSTSPANTSDHAAMPIMLSNRSQSFLPT